MEVEYCRKRNTCVDYDDVITETVPAILNYYWHRTNRLYLKEDVWTYDLWKVWGCDKEESFDVIRGFYASEFFDALQPCPGAIDALHEIAGKTQVHIVTARSSEIRRKSELFFEQHTPSLSIPLHHATGYFENVENGRKRTKSEICSELQAEMIVDDHPVFSYQCACSGIQTYIIDQPWNRSVPKHPLLYRVERGGLAAIVDLVGNRHAQFLNTVENSPLYEFTPKGI